MKQPKLLESIRLESGQYYHLKYHEARMRRSCAALGIGFHSLPLTDFLKHVSHPNKGLWKCRVLYSNRIEKIEFQKYRAKPIRSLQLVYDNDISYAHKYQQRDALAKLYAQRGNCDDIIIVKDQLLTDSYYGNIVLHKDGIWYTPESHLLTGTQRASLLDRGRIQAKPIRVDNLHGFDKVKIINAMMDLESGFEVEIGKIRT